MKGRLRGSLALLLSGFLVSSCTSIQPRTVYSPEGAVREGDSRLGPSALALGLQGGSETGSFAASCPGLAREPQPQYSPATDSMTGEWPSAARSLDWTQAKWHEGVAVKTLSQRTGSSTHLVRIEGREKPHVHDTHDLVAVMLEGKVLLHVEGKEILAKPGDVIEIPRGTIHWAENRARGASEAYAVFSPPFDGKDHRVVKGRIHFPPQSIADPTSTLAGVPPTVEAR